MIWRKDTDFKDYNFYDFPLFEMVIDRETLKQRVISSFSPFTIGEPFQTILSDAIYDYCFGKMCNLKNDERWKLNFLGDISIFLLEKGRYFQAYVRDINSNIDQDNSYNLTTEGEIKIGKVDTKKNGNISNSEGSEVLGNNEQNGQLNLGDTLTVLNNQTTSTRHLASSTEEAYSTGSVTENSSSGFSKNVNNEISLAIENGASLSDQKDINTQIYEGKKSPLDISKEESNFNFKDWIEPLYIILDSYFLQGGNDYA